MSLNQITAPFPLLNLYASSVNVPDKRNTVEYASTMDDYIRANPIRSHIVSYGKQQTIFCNAQFQKNATAAPVGTHISFVVPGLLFPPGQVETAVVNKLAENPIISLADDVCLFAEGIGGTNVITIKKMVKNGVPQFIDLATYNDGDDFEIAFTMTAISA